MLTFVVKAGKIAVFNPELASSFGRWSCRFRILHLDPRVIIHRA